MNFVDSRINCFNADINDIIPDSCIIWIGKSIFPLVFEEKGIAVCIFNAVIGLLSCQFGVFKTYNSSYDFNIIVVAFLYDLCKVVIALYDTELRGQGICAVEHDAV